MPESGGSRRPTPRAASRETFRTRCRARDSRSRRSLRVRHRHGGAAGRYLRIDAPSAKECDIRIAERRCFRGTLPSRLGDDTAIALHSNAIIDPALRVIADEIAPVELAEPLGGQNVAGNARIEWRRTFLSARDARPVFGRMEKLASRAR